MHRTKVFITIPWFLPAFRAGGPVQSIANLVRELDTDIEFWIYCGDTDLNGGELENITTNEWVSFNEHTRVWYAAPEKISDNLSRQVEIIKPDVLYIIGIFSWHYNIVPLIFCKAPRKILSVRGMLHPGALSQKKWKKRIFLSLFRLLEYPHKITFHACNNEEKKYIEAHFGAVAKAFVAGNFSNKMGFLASPEKIVGELKLLSVAIISPMKNILLILQALEKQNALIQYDIYGPVKDEYYWDQCVELIKKLPANISVFVHREIEPSRVSEVLSASQVFILPSKSENFGHAIYEALSAGKPVITSKNTPWNLLEQSHAGINVSLENNNELEKAIDFFAQMAAEEFSVWMNGALAFADNSIDSIQIKRDYERMFHNPL